MRLDSTVVGQENGHKQPSTGCVLIGDRPIIRFVWLREINMSLDSIGIIAEVIGAIAVVVSLLYVASQIKQSNRQSASDSGFALISELNRFLDNVLSEPEVVNVLVKLKSGAPLAPDEAIRAEALAEQLINNWWVAETSYRNGIMEEDSYQAITDEATRYIKNYPSLRSYFLKILGHYHFSKNMRVFAAVYEGEQTRNE